MPRLIHLKDVHVKGVYNLQDIYVESRKYDELKISAESNIFMLKLLIEELGSSLVQKLCRKCKTANPISHCIYLVYVLEIFIVNMRKNCLKKYFPWTIVF